MTIWSCHPIVKFGVSISDQIKLEITRFCGVVCQKSNLLNLRLQWTSDPDFCSSVIRLILLSFLLFFAGRACGEFFFAFPLQLRVHHVPCQVLVNVDRPASFDAKSLSTYLIQIWTLYLVKLLACAHVISPKSHQSLDVFMPKRNRKPMMTTAAAATWKTKWGVDVRWLSLAGDFVSRLETRDEQKASVELCQAKTNEA